MAICKSKATWAFACTYALLFAGKCVAGGWTGDLMVTSAFTEARSDVIAVYTTGGSAYAIGCTANAWIFTADSDARRGRGYATILAAMAAGKPVRFWFGDSCTIWNYHEATTVMLVN